MVDENDTHLSDPKDDQNHLVERMFHHESKLENLKNDQTDLSYPKEQKINKIEFFNFIY